MEEWSVRAVVLRVEESNERTESLFLRLREIASAFRLRERMEMTDERILDISIDIDTSQPLVSQIRSTVQVDRGDDFHVRCIRKSQRGSTKEKGKRTLSPLSTTVRHLALDDLENVELKRRMRYLENPLEDSLRFTNVSAGAANESRTTYRALVLNEEEDSMRLPLRELLQNMHKVDDGEEISPRIV